MNWCLTNLRLVGHREHIVQRSLLSTQAHDYNKSMPYMEDWPRIILPSWLFLHCFECKSAPQNAPRFSNTTLWEPSYQRQGSDDGYHSNILRYAVHCFLGLGKLASHA